MTHRFDRSVVLGLGLLVALLVGNTVVSYRNTRELNENARSVTHTHEVLEALNEVRDQANRAEAMQRNHVITGDDHFIPLFTDALAAARDQVGQVKRLTADNPTQQARVPALEAQLDAIERRLTRTAVVRKEQGFDAARQIVLTGESRKQIDDLLSQVEEMERDEHELLRDRQRNSDRAYAVAVTTGLIAAGLGLAAVLAFVWLMDRHQKARAKAAAAVHAHKELLHATITSIGDGVIATDARGRVTFLNPVAQRLTGWTQDEAHGQPLETVFRIVNEATRQPVENPALRALREGQIVGLANHTLLIARDGTERPIDDSAAPIRDGDSVTGAVLVFRDVTERRRLERQIAERGAAAHLLASIVESSNDAVISKSLDGTIQSWNAAAERLFGYTAEQAVGRHITMLIPADRTAEEDQIIARLRAGERIEHYDTVRLRSDGRPVHVSLTISPVRDEAGRVVGASKIVRDVTDRKRAEEALWRERGTPPNAFDPIDEGRHHEAFRRADRSGGSPLPAGQRPSSRTYRSTTPGEAIGDWTLRAYGALVATHGKIADSLASRPASDNGRGTAHDRQVRSRTSPSARSAGAAVAVLRVRPSSTSPPVSRPRPAARKRAPLPHAGRAGQGLRHLHDRPAGRATSWNEGVQRVLGYEEAEWLGQDVVPLIFTPEDMRDGCARRELEQAATEGSASNDRWMMKKDSTRFFALGVTTALRDDDGQLLGFTKVMRDQTERHRLENELRQVAADLAEADRRKDEFLAMLAHELRNPLAPIRNAVEILRRSDHDPAAVRRAHEMMERQVNQMARLVDDLLDVSRISRGKIELRTGAGRAGRGHPPRRRGRPPAVREQGPRARRHAAARAGPPDRRPGPAGAGGRQPAHQRRQVHRPAAAASS